jgi:hypothetical protein
MDVEGALLAGTQLVDPAHDVLAGDRAARVGRDGGEAGGERIAHVDAGAGGVAVVAREEAEHGLSAHGHLAAPDPGLLDPDIDGAGRERHVVGVVGEVVGIPGQVRERDDDGGDGEVVDDLAGAFGRERPLDRDHAVLAGPELRDVTGDEREEGARRRAKTLAGRVVAADAGATGDRHGRALQCLLGPGVDEREAVAREHVDRAGSVAVDAQRVRDRAARDRVCGSEGLRQRDVGSVEISAVALLSSGLISLPIGADTVAVLASSAADG